jgi:Uma2 family endonuclease
MSTSPLQFDPTISGPVLGQPAWELALLFPLQGEWGEAEYLGFTAATNRLVEFSDGRVEVLPMPSSSHQRILIYLLTQLQAFILPAKLGEALCAPLRVKIRDGKFREPDLVFMRAENGERIGEEYWDGADLVLEVVSPDPEARKRDLQQKPLDYAEARIPEYWIVDPQEKKITVLQLQGDTYETHGEFSEGDVARSLLLSGFAVNVTQVFQAAVRSV